jgi:transposase-like protein
MIEIKNFPVLEYENPRVRRANAMINNGFEPKRIKEHIFNVPSQSSKRFYTVIREGKYLWSCSCPDHSYREKMCKHIIATKMWLDMKRKMLNDSHEEDDDKFSCKYCGSDKIVKNGKRTTRLGVKNRYLCKDCRKSFVVEECGFSNMKFDAKTVTLCLDLYFKGTSLRKIQEHLRHFHDIEIHWTTISKWIKKYTAIINEYVKTLEPKLSHVWHADEMMIKSGGEYVWLWNVMDRDTRFLLSSLITKKRSIVEARKVFRGAKEQAKARPRVMVTDGLWSYKKAFNKEFYTRKGPRPFLVRHAGPSTIVNNNKIERLHGTIREREKVMRGMQNEETAKILMDGFRHYYNFIRPHQALNGLTPAEMAGLKLDLGENKWLGLIKESVKHLKKNSSIN